MNQTTMSKDYPGKNNRGKLLGRRLVFSVAFVLLLSIGEISSAATSVSQFEFTWTFSEDKPVGQYANGDWWVVGPVTITSISPASTTDATGWTRNGTMVNPAPGTLSPSQGFDSSLKQAAWWNPSLNVAPAFTGRPLVVPANTSVVSALSVNSPSTNPYGYTQLAAGAVLTIVETAPAPGSFRPPMVGTDKTHRWNKSNLNYGILKKLAPVPSTPALSTLEQRFERPWFCLKEGPSVQCMSPAANMPHYGRDQAHLVSEGMLSLHLNYTDAQKEKLYIRLVQIGIDVYGATKAGMIWTDDGGQNCGRKAPMVMAGIALNDANILDWANASRHFVFQEDRQTWFVTPADVGRSVTTADGRPRETYRQEHIGLPEWGEQHIRYPANDASNWNAYYRWAGGSWQGNILAISLIPGGEAAWNWAPVFAYADRYWKMEGAKQTYGPPNAITPFVCDMWKSYRSGGSDVIPPENPPVYHAIGNRIKTLNDTNVRATGALNGTWLGVQTKESLGTIRSGPVFSDNIVWWEVDYDTGIDGWSGADNFIKKASTPKLDD